MLRRIRHFLINFWPERLGPTDRCQTTEDELHECRVALMKLRMAHAEVRGVITVNEPEEPDDV